MAQVQPRQWPVAPEDQNFVAPCLDAGNSSDASIRDGAKQRSKLAQQAISLSAGRDPLFSGRLAAAYANRSFSKAIAIK